MKATAEKLKFPAHKMTLTEGNPEFPTATSASFVKEMRLVRGKWIIETVIVVAVLLVCFLLVNKLIDNQSQSLQNRVNAIVGASEADMVREFDPGLLTRKEYEEHQSKKGNSVDLSLPYSDRVYYREWGFDVVYFFVREGKVTMVLLGKT